jgi:CubicO group peptidase (beta-lactamase class C family)
VKPYSSSAAALHLAGSLLLGVVLLGLVACGTSAPTRPPPTHPPTAASDAAPASTAASTAAGAPLAATLPAADRARHELAAAYSAERGGQAVLILQGDEVVFEAGQNGHAVNAPLPLYSASESFWGLLAVAADADGLLDLDEPAAFTLPEFAADPGKREIRIRQLLNFTSGLAPGVRSLARERTPNLYDRALELEMISSPGDRFQYGPGQLYVFAEVLKRKLAAQGGDPVDYLAERILAPIGVEVADWERDEAGNPDVALGAWLAPREWAKFGLLLKNRGAWQGREIVPAAAVAPVFEPSSASDEYGLTVWLNGGATAGTSSAASSFYPGGLPDLALAAGLGNQRLYVIPSRDLVVVRFGKRDRRWRDQEFLARLVDGTVE